MKPYQVELRPCPPMGKRYLFNDPGKRGPHLPQGGGLPYVW